MTTPTQPTRKTLTVNGLALHYLEWGEAEAPDIVCVHGYTGSADAFNALARDLEDRYRILALDVRGHGESAWSPTGAYSYADQAGDLAEFAKQLGLEKFVLVGTSMGGIIAMAYAAEHAERLLGLVIGVPPLGVADPRRAQCRGPARAGARRAAAPTRRQVGMEDGPGLYRAAGKAWRAGAAPLVARAAGPAVLDNGGVGEGE